MIKKLWKLLFDCRHVFERCEEPESQKNSCWRPERHYDWRRCVKCGQMQFYWRYIDPDSGKTYDWHDSSEKSDPATNAARPIQRQI